MIYILVITIDFEIPGFSCILGAFDNFEKAAERREKIDNYINCLKNDAECSELPIEYQEVIRTVFSDQYSLLKYTGCIILQYDLNE
jgi:hypothetical protein